MVRDFLEGRRGRGSTARRNPAVTHGRIELFIVMAGCSASLCVGVGRVRGPPVRGRILSLLLPLSTIILPFLPPSLLSFHSFFSPLDFGIYKYRYREGGLSAPIYNTAALFLQLSRAPPPPSPSSLPFHSPPRPSLAAPPPPPLSSPEALLQRVQRAAHSRCMDPAGCPTPTYMAAAQLYPCPANC